MSVGQSVSCWTSGYAWLIIFLTTGVFLLFFGITACLVACCQCCVAYMTQPEFIIIEQQPVMRMRLAQSSSSSAIYQSNRVINAAEHPASLHSVVQDVMDARPHLMVDHSTALNPP